MIPLKLQTSWDPVALPHARGAPSCAADAYSMALQQGERPWWHSDETSGLLLPPSRPDSGDTRRTVSMHAGEAWPQPGDAWLPHRQDSSWLGSRPVSGDALLLDLGLQPREPA